MDSTLNSPLRLKIAHTTRYQYQEPVSYTLQQIRLTPKSGSQQKVLSWHIDIENGDHEVEFDDHFGNRVCLVSATPGEREISITSAGEIEVSDNSGLVGSHQGFAPLWYFRRATSLTEADTGVNALLRELGDGYDSDIARLHAMMALIAERVRYQTGSSTATTTAADALEAGEGVCQDHTHIMLSLARLLGHPARYVSGYLMMNDRVEQEATHAWAEVHCDDIGWVGFDVSNGISPDQRYVRVATGLDYLDAAPISGMRFGSGNENLSVSLQVQQQ